MLELGKTLRRLKKLVFSEGNFSFLPVRQQVDLLLDHLEEGEILPGEFIARYQLWGEGQTGKKTLSCQRLIVFDNHPGITKEDPVGLAYDALDESNFTDSRGSALFRDTWYSRTQEAIDRKQGRVSLVGLGLRFYPGSWTHELHSSHFRGAIDLWAERRRGKMNIRLDLLKPTDDGHLRDLQRTRFADSEEFRQRFINNQAGFSETPIPRVLLM